MVITICALVNIFLRNDLFFNNLDLINYCSVNAQGHGFDLLVNCDYALTLSQRVTRSCVIEDLNMLSTLTHTGHDIHIIIIKKYIYIALFFK